MMIFEDEAVYAAVEAEGAACEADLQRIECLSLNDVHMLNDLPRFSALRDLRISGGHVRSGKPLSELKGLTRLELHHVTGIDGNHLQGLTQLKHLEISNCGFSDLSALGGMKRLEYLALPNNGIVDISPLAGLKRLRELWIHKNPIEDVSPLLPLFHLKKLYIALDRVKDKSILNQKPFTAALDRYDTDVSEACPKDHSAPPKSRPRMEYMGHVHPRIHFCRDAALVQIRGGMERIVCRDGGKGNSQTCRLYLDDKMLIDAYINDCPSYGGFLEKGYGDGVSNTEEYLEARDRLNGSFSGMRQAAEDIVPLMGLMASGWYVVADMELFPYMKEGCRDGEYFWDAPEYRDECQFIRCYVGGGVRQHILPHYFFPTRRASSMDEKRVGEYMSRLETEGEAFPRAMALYLNGSIALLLDGHHKAAAAAALGKTVRTLVIFPVRESGELKQALHEGKRLYLHPFGSRWASVLLRDGNGEEITTGISLEKMKRSRLYVPSAVEAIPWGRVGDEYRTERFEEYPRSDTVFGGVMLPPDEVQQTISELMTVPKWAIDIRKLGLIGEYAELFPDSPQLTPSQRAWIREAEEKWYEWSWLRPNQTETD